MNHETIMTIFRIQQDFISCEKDTNELLKLLLNLFINLTKKYNPDDLIQGFIAIVSDEYIIPINASHKSYKKIFINYELNLNDNFKLFMKNSNKNENSLYLPIFSFNTDVDTDVNDINSVIGIIGSTNTYKIDEMQKVFEPIVIVCGAVLRKKFIEENLDIEKGTLMSYIGHELKTPLTSAVGFTQLLKHSKSNKHKKKYINLIEESYTELISTVNNTIDYSKLLLDKIKLNYSAYNVEECISESVNIIACVARKKNIKITYNVDQSLTGNINLDSDRFKQLLINVMTSIVSIIGGYNSNSVKEKSTILINCIRISMNKFDKFDKLCVRISLDNKSSLNIEEIRERLSDKMETPGSNKKIYEGIDLNLQIAKRLSKLFDGMIKIENHNYVLLCIYLIKLKKLDTQNMSEDLLDNRHCIILSEDVDLRLSIYSNFESQDISCSSFSTLKELGYFIKKMNKENKSNIGFLSSFILLTDFKLPSELALNINNIVDISDWDMEKIETEEFIVSEIIKIINKNKNYVKILIVEDNNSNRTIISAYLDILGWKNVTIVNNGKEAVDVVTESYKSKKDFNIIFMDINMPIMDGITAFNLIKNIYSLCDKQNRPYVIALTAFSHTDSGEMDDHISKPIIKISQLETALQKYLFLKKK